ncbi:3-isopropylmalate dehydrogenase, partial [Clavibacter michiganensis]
RVTAAVSADLAARAAGDAAPRSTAEVGDAVIRALSTNH